MKIKYIIPLLISFMFISSVSESQVIMMGRRPPRYHMRHPRQRYQENLPKFEPSVNLSLGYGFPNGDKAYVPDYYNEYNSNITQMGPFTGSLDYRFSRNMSIGVLVTHGTVKAPYYSYGSLLNTPDFNVKLDNWAYMLNLVRYHPVTKNVTVYTRVAIGINSWKQDFTDAGGNKINMAPANLPDLAYQAGLGAQFKMSKNAVFFVEGGYGKYILNAGLSFKF
jgi:hypothetical protein